MTNKEVIKEIQEEIEACSEGAIDEDGSCICSMYPCWRMKAKECVEKQIPMEHHHTFVYKCSDGGKVRVSICPSCLGCILTVEEEFPRFCDWCGQALKWE